MVRVGASKGSFLRTGWYLGKWLILKGCPKECISMWKEIFVNEFLMRESDIMVRREI
jgi:hypothetical protein